jgi:DNA-binding transcriptional MerR regulator
MADKTKELLEKCMEHMDQIKHIPLSEFPNIDLYMDQVTTFMNEHLQNAKRHPDDKILTKTMINNYAKDKVLPAPIKKKYSREHLLTMAFIYYFKNLLSISDIQKLLTPLSEKYFHSEDGLDVADIYNEIYNIGGTQLASLKKDILEKYELCANSFVEITDEDRDFLQQFALICELSFDVYYKKLLVEKMIDSLMLPVPDCTEAEDSAKEHRKKKEKN